MPKRVTSELVTHISKYARLWVFERTRRQRGFYDFLHQLNVIVDDKVGHKYTIAPPGRQQVNKWKAGFIAQLGALADTISRLNFSSYQNNIHTRCVPYLSTTFLTCFFRETPAENALL